MRLRSIAVVFFLMWGLSVSCIREDHSDCYNRYILDLSYLGDGTEEIFSEKIDKVRMYIFDEGGTCVHSEELSVDEVRYRSVMLPALDAGDYRIVCLGNPYTTGVEGLASGDPDEVLFAAEDHISGKTVSGNDPLYWASTDYTIEPYSEKMQEHRKTALFACSHYDITVEVVGVPAAVKSGGYPSIELAGVSPYTDFRNRACGESVTYVMDASHDGMATMKAAGNIMRHTAHEDVYLRVVAPDGGALADVNFAEFIEANASYIDCSKHEVLIPFRIEFKSAEVTVSVPDWMIKDVKPEF